MAPSPIITSVGEPNKESIPAVITYAAATAAIDPATMAARTDLRFDLSMSLIMCADEKGSMRAT